MFFADKIKKYYNSIIFYSLSSYITMSLYRQTHSR